MKGNQFEQMLYYQKLMFLLVDDREEQLNDVMGLIIRLIN